jgi:hypothetical protein
MLSREIMHNLFLKKIFAQYHMTFLPTSQSMNNFSNFRITFAIRYLHVCRGSGNVSLQILGHRPQKSGRKINKINDSQQN